MNLSEAIERVRSGLVEHRLGGEIEKAFEIVSESALATLETLDIAYGRLLNAGYSKHGELCTDIMKAMAITKGGES